MEAACLHGTVGPGPAGWEEEWTVGAFLLKEIQTKVYYEAVVVDLFSGMKWG